MAPAQAAFHRARPPLLRHRSRRPRHCWMAPAQSAHDRARPPLPRPPLPRPPLPRPPLPRPPLRRRRSSRRAPWWMAPIQALVCRARRSPLRCRRALCVSPDDGPSGASARAAAHTTREPVHSRHQSPPRRHIPAAVRCHIWQRDGGRCCYRDPLTGRRCTSSHLLQVDPASRYVLAMAVDFEHRAPQQVYAHTGSVPRQRWAGFAAGCAANRSRAPRQRPAQASGSRNSLSGSRLLRATKPGNSGRPVDWPVGL